MNIAQILPILLLVLALAWANGANDVAKGVATLAGGGLANARRAVRWGTLCTVLGGLAALVWGRELIATFGGGLLTAEFRVTTGFVTAALLGAAIWIAAATRLGLPVSTTHALLGATLGAALATGSLGGIRTEVFVQKALLPLLATPLVALALCWLLMRAARYVERRIPAWRPGCCEHEAWRTNPFVCSTGQQPDGWRQRLWIWLHWLSSGVTSFARGLNDTPKIAAFLILAGMLVPGLADTGGNAMAIVLVSLAMGAGSLWGGYRVLDVLAHRVVPLDPASGLSANAGTSVLVLAATPLGLPVSTTHVSTGALFGVRVARSARPDGTDALKLILFGWLVTFPLAGLGSAIAMRAFFT
jgi:PiT family inorganic phosphate transporter